MSPSPLQVVNIDFVGVLEQLEHAHPLNISGQMQALSWLWVLNFSINIVHA
jgi:hypothetical protein